MYNFLQKHNLLEYLIKQNPHDYHSHQYPHLFDKTHPQILKISLQDMNKMNMVMLNCMHHKFMVISYQDHQQYKYDPTIQIMSMKCSPVDMVQMMVQQLMIDCYHKFYLYCQTFFHFQMKLMIALYKCLNYSPRNVTSLKVDSQYLYSLIESMQDYSKLKVQKLCFIRLNTNNQILYLSNYR